MKIKNKIWGAGFALFLMLCVNVFAGEKSTQNLVSFPKTFTTIDDTELQLGDLLSNEEGKNEFEGYTKTIYGKKADPMPRHVVYHSGKKVVSYKLIATPDILSMKVNISGVELHATVLALITIRKELQGEKKLSREETLLFEAFALEMEHLSVGDHTDKTIDTNLRVVVSREQDTVEIEFIPLKTFLALKRAGLRL